MDEAGYEVPEDVGAAVHVYKDEADPDQPRYAINQLGLVAVALGSVGLAIAEFLPLDEQTTLFARIQENTLLQQEGWPFLIFAAFAGLAAYRSYANAQRTWAPTIWGVFGLAYAIYLGTNKSLRTLYPIGANGEPDTSQAGTVAAIGIAVYAAGAASLLLCLGGRLIRQSPLVESEPTRRCPDCAETILAVARVCKHCGTELAANKSPER
jgi:hypothetical protein